MCMYVCVRTDLHKRTVMGARDCRVQSVSKDACVSHLQLNSKHAPALKIKPCLPKLCLSKDLCDAALN